MNKFNKALLTPFLLMASFSANAILFDFSGVVNGDYTVGDPVLTFSDSGIAYTLSNPSTNNFFRFDSGQLLFGAKPTGGNQFNLTSFDLVVTGGDAVLLGYSTGNKTSTGDTFNITGSNTGGNYNGLNGSTASNSVVLAPALTLLENQIYSFNYNLGANNPTTAGTTGLGSLDVEPSVAAVPVPAAVWLFGSALLGLVGIRRKKINNK